MDLDVDACYRAFRTRDAALRRAAVQRGQDHRDLLPSDLSGAHAETREHELLSDRSGGAGSGLPAVPALPAGNGARARRLARDVEHGVAGVGADRRGRPRRGRSRSPGRASGRRRATAPPAVSTASRRVSRLGRADQACPPGETTDPRDTPPDGRSGAGVGVWQHPTLQRDLSAAVRPSAGRSAARQRRRHIVGTQRRS